VLVVGGEVGMEIDGLMLTEEQRLIRRKESLSQCHVVCRKSQIDWPAIGSVPPTSDSKIIISVIFVSLYLITIFVIVGDVEIC
jgi:hypothetical protein